jgi:hypothetical protein
VGPVAFADAVFVEIGIAHLKQFSLCFGFRYNVADAVAYCNPLGDYDAVWQCVGVSISSRDPVRQSDALTVANARKPLFIADVDALIDAISLPVASRDP